LNLKEIDMSRTRLIDQDMGYQADRVITFIKEEGWFVVVDAIKIFVQGISRLPTSGMPSTS